MFWRQLSSTAAKINTVGPCHKGNAYKGEPHVKAILLRSKTNAGFSYAKKFHYKGLCYKGCFNVKVKVFVQKWVYSTNKGKSEKNWKSFGVSLRKINVSLLSKSEKD